MAKLGGTADIIRPFGGGFFIFFEVVVSWTLIMIIADTVLYQHMV
jgi:hypothetical protein